MDNFERNFKLYLFGGLLAFIIVGAIIYIVSEIQNYKFFIKTFDSHIKTTDYEHINLEAKNAIQLILNEIKYEKDSVEKITKDMVRKDVYNAIRITDNIYENFSKKLPLQELERIISETLLSLQNKERYIFAGDLKGINKVNPKIPMGIDTYNFQDIKGQYLVRNMIKIAKTKGEGFIEYYWYKPDNINNILKKYLL